DLRDRASLEELADLLRRARADAGNAGELLLAERAEVAAIGGDRLQSVLVRPHAECVRGALLEDRELGELAEERDQRIVASGHRVEFISDPRASPAPAGAASRTSDGRRARR